MSTYDNNQELPLSYHFEALRRSLLQIITLWAVICAILLATSDYWMMYLLKHFPMPANETPIEWLQIHNSTKEPITTNHLQETITVEPGATALVARTRSIFIALSPLEGFTSYLRCSVYLAAWLSLPLSLVLLARFIWPGLTPTEQRLFRGLSISLVSCWFAGSWLSFNLITPKALHWFFEFNRGYAYNLWSLTSYVDFLLIALVICALVLFCCAGLVLLAALGLIAHSWLKSFQKPFILLAFVFGAIITPPDVSSQIAVALPLIAAYYLAWFVASLRQ